MVQKISPMDPNLIVAWNKGREAGKKEATEMFNNFLIEKMQTLTEISGIGEKIAWKIQEHFLQEKEDTKCN